MYVERSLFVWRVTRWHVCTTSTLLTWSPASTTTRGLATTITSTILRPVLCGSGSSSSTCRSATSSSSCVDIASPRPRTPRLSRPTTRSGGTSAVDGRSIYSTHCTLSAARGSYRCGHFPHMPHVAWSACLFCAHRPTVQKRMNRSRCRLECGLVKTQGTMY